MTFPYLIKVITYYQKFVCVKVFLVVLISSCFWAERRGRGRVVNHAQVDVADMYNRFIQRCSES